MLLNSILVAAAAAASQLVATQSQTPDIPSIPTRYAATIEANIANKETTYILEEWYDRSEQKAKRIFHSGSYVFTILEDYANDTDELWIYLQDASDLDSVHNCSLEAYSNKSSTWVQFLQVLGQWLHNDGSMDDATYVDEVGDEDDNGEECGDYNMRGIRGNKWIKEAVYNSSSSGTEVYDQYNISYYWSIPNWTYARHNGEIPLRIEVLGSHNDTSASGWTNYYEFYHSYEYISFFYGDDAFDEDVLDFYLEMPDWTDECDTSHYCAHYPDASVCSDSRGPDLPTLSNQFMATVEINDKLSHTSYLLDEYYDYLGDRVHLVFHYGDNYLDDAWHQLELDEWEQQWTWFGDDDDLTDCKLSLVDSNYTGVDLAVEEIQGHIARPSSWFHFNSSNVNNKVWLGYTTVREHILAEKWKGVWYEEYAYLDWWVVFNATSYYYFNRDSWNMSFSNFSSNSPLRMELEGFYEIYNTSDDSDEKIYWFNGSIDNSYDIVGFINGNLDDSDFAVPDSWREYCTISEDYCNDARFEDLDVCYSGPSELPVLPTQFQATVEAVFVTKNFSMVVDEFYDYDNNRERVVIYPYNYQSTLFDFSYAVTWSTHYLEDGDIFWSWSQSNGEAVDMDGKEVLDCKLFETRTIQGGGIDTWFDASKDHVQTTANLFAWVTNNSVETYIGTGTTRGIPCDKWKHEFDTIELTFEYGGTSYDYEINMTVVYSFMTDEYKSTDIYGDYGVPLRCDVWGNTKVTSESGFESEYEFEHYYNYIKFLPYEPDEGWFYPPQNVTCNITSYCNALDASTGDSSSDSVDGESSDEFADWCDEMVNGMIVTDTEDGSSGCSGSSSTSNNSESSDGGEEIWIVAIILCILCGVGGVFYGQYRQKKKMPMVRLQDDTNDPDL